MKTTNRWPPPPEPHLHHIGHPQSPDTPHVMVSRINGKICSKSNNHGAADCMGHIHKDPEEEESTTEGNIFTTTNSSFGYSCSSAETSDATSVSASLSSHVAGRWCEEEKAYPLKKRRVISEETVILKKEKKTVNNNNKNVVKGGVKSKRDKKKYWVDAGLRCNRANGKEWRCSQQRLDGHTMCKYHVTMGKIRNQGQSQSQNGAIFKPKKVKNICNDDEDGERVGVVKARSMSSLLRNTVPLLPVTL